MSDKAREFYNKRAIKHQLKRATKNDAQYFEDCVIKIMQAYADQEKLDLVENHEFCFAVRKEITRGKSTLFAIPDAYKKKYLNQQ